MLIVFIFFFLDLNPIHLILFFLPLFCTFNPEHFGLNFFSNIVLRFQSFCFFLLKTCPSTLTQTVYSTAHSQGSLRGLLSPPDALHTKLSHPSQYPFLTESQFIRVQGSYPGPYTPGESTNQLTRHVNLSGSCDTHPSRQRLRTT